MERGLRIGYPFVWATDTAGNTQPVEQFWNAQGMGNNMAQQVRVLVE